MSYARQYGDKPGQWFWENPPDAKEGDERRIGRVWHTMNAYELDACLLDSKERRRLIQAGEGFRILGLKEVLKSRAMFEATRDGLTWTKDQVADDEEWTPEQYVAYDNIIAIRVPIVVEQEDEFETWWQSKSTRNSEHDKGIARDAFAAGRIADALEKKEKKDK